MPRKKRDVRREYRQAGYFERHGKGDHLVYTYPGVDENFSVDGRDGADAQPYDERDLKRAKRKIQEVRRKERKP